MPRPAPFERYLLRPLRLLLVCCALAACTQPSGDEQLEHLVREVPPLSTTNRALHFDGVGDYATTGTAMFPVGRGTQTISAWFELETISGKYAIITLRKDGDSGVELALQNGLLGAWRVYGNRALVMATTPVTAGTWHHAAYTYNMMTNQLYLDGVLVASSTNPPDERTPTTCWLGTLDGTNDLFKGSIDDFRVFTVVRSSMTIRQEANGSFSNADAGLVMALSCNESTGDLLYDQSPVANDGLLGDGVDQRKPTRVMSGAPQDTN